MICCDRGSALLTEGNFSTRHVPSVCQFIVVQFFARVADAYVPALSRMNNAVLCMPHIVLSHGQRFLSAKIRPRNASFSLPFCACNSTQKPIRTATIVVLCWLDLSFPSQQACRALCGDTVLSWPSFVRGTNDSRHKVRPCSFFQSLQWANRSGQAKTKETFMEISCPRGGFILFCFWLLFSDST
jgi:hypothetical protein